MLLNIIAIVIATDVHARQEINRVHIGPNWDVSLIRAIILIVFCTLQWLIYSILLNLDFDHMNVIGLMKMHVGLFSIAFDNFYNIHKKNMSGYLNQQAIGDRVFIDKHPIEMIIETCILVAGVTLYWI